jgi:pimeloyl-ACP methyl ester carboxylesterase
MADELYALLEQSGHDGPYILVGHSMGGAIVRWFLAAHPNDVAGMVLVDAATEDWPSKVLARVPVDDRAEFWRNLRAWEGLDPDAYVAGYEGLRSVTTSLGDRPLVILTAEKPENELALRLEMQAALERLSSNTLHVVVKNSGHNIQLQAPETVVHYVQAVVRAARAHSVLSPPAR